MGGLILGIDLCDDYSQISCYNEQIQDVEIVTISDDEAFVRIPTVICKKRGENTWLVGEEAYRSALFGDGTLVDRLIKQQNKKGQATIEGITYTADTLLSLFIAKLIEQSLKKYDCDRVENLVFTLDEPGASINDVIVRAAEDCGVERERVHIMTHTEAFVYYVLSQDSDIWANQTCAFDLREDGLFYYEMKIIRGRKPQVVEAWHEKLQESFSLDILGTESGERLGDTILAACGERLLNKKIVSSVFLTGKGFVKADWAPSFLKLICNKRRAFQVPQLFAHGAVYAALDNTRETSAYPFLISCEGRIRSTISLYAVYGGRREQVILAQAGINWYEARSSVEFILDDIHTLELNVTPVGGVRMEKITISLDDLPARPNKTTVIELILSFTADNTMTVRIVDKGFGELYPASGKVIKMDYKIP
ncbi:MAG: hypothetical protein J5865_08005 [Lachnospiraceae bacterium]|nr:hypothetical protein [Lachnospiraceae bacterium]